MPAAVHAEWSYFIDEMLNHGGKSYTQVIKGLSSPRNGAGELSAVTIGGGASLGQ